MNKVTLLLLACSLTLPFQLLAATYTYHAISDFPDITSGEVPFYKDTAGNRNVLAIDDTQVEYRYRFARATRTFDGPTGNYDVTIVALGEIDGESIYRLSVSGTIVGIRENARTSNNFAEQAHVFKDVMIAEGATIAVDASAVSNELVPEHGGFAHARGRWRSLSASTAGEVSDDIDLAIAISATPSTVYVGDTVNYSMTVSNLSTDRTATGLSLSANLPPELSFGSGADCSSSNNEVNCLLPELAPKTSNTISWSAKAINAGNAIINATANADQEDNVSINNTATSKTLISAENLVKDAGVVMSLTNGTFNTDDSSELRVTVKNNGSNDLAAIIVELSAESDLILSKPLESCIQESENLSCTIDSLLSHESVTLSSNVSSTVPGTYTIEANVLLGADEVIENNTATVTMGIEAAAITKTDTDSDSGKFGFGSVTILMLGLLSILTFRRRLS